MPSVIDRLLVLPIKQPDQLSMSTIARNIYRDANARHAYWFASEPNDDLIKALVQHNPRKAPKIIEFAMGHAAMNGRKLLLPKDVVAALAFVDQHYQARRQVGFTAP